MSKKTSNNNKKQLTIILGVVGVIVALVLAVGGYFLYQNLATKSNLKDNYALYNDLYKKAEKLAKDFKDTGESDLGSEDTDVEALKNLIKEADSLEKEYNSAKDKVKNGPNKNTKEVADLVRSGLDTDSNAVKTAKEVAQAGVCMQEKMLQFQEETSASQPNITSEDELSLYYVDVALNMGNKVVSCVNDNETFKDFRSQFNQLIVLLEKEKSGINMKIEGTKEGNQEKIDQGLAIQEEAEKEANAINVNTDFLDNMGDDLDKKSESAKKAIEDKIKEVADKYFMFKSEDILK